MSLLTVIIPTLNAADCIADVLADLKGFEAEIVVVDGGSSDATIEIVKRSTTNTRVIQTFAGRGNQIAFGISKVQDLGKCDNQWFLVLHADSRIKAAAVLAVKHHMQNHSAKAGYFSLRFRSQSVKARALEWVANLRSLVLGLPYGDQGLLISAKHLVEIGGYPSVPLMEDLLVVKRLGRKRLRCLGTGLTTSADKYEREGWLKRSLLHFCCFSLHCLGAQPKTILKLYRL